MACSPCFRATKKVTGVSERASPWPGGACVLVTDPAGVAPGPAGVRCWQARVLTAALFGVVVGGDPVGGGAVVLVGPGCCYRPGGSDGPADQQLGVPAG